MKEKKDPVILEAFFSLSFFSFSSVVTRAFPWPIKGKARRPMEVIDPSSTDRITLNRSEHKINTQEHDTNTAEQRSSSQHPFTLSTKDLGSFPSLARLYPLLQTCSTSNMSSSNELDVGTFCRTSINLIFSKHTIQARCAILEIYSSVVTQNTDSWCIR